MIKIVYEDKNILIVEKPCNIIVHPDQHHQKNTILDLIKDKLDFTDFTLNQGIVHRLDKAVSGLMLVARNQKAWNYFKAELKNHNIVRKYYALVKGKVNWEQLKIDLPLLKPGKTVQAKVSLSGKKAVTYLEVVQRWENKTLLKCRLETGRTHQIRAHLRYINHPVINDALYNQGNNCCIFLYSYFLSFRNLETKKTITLEKTVPKFFNI